MAIEIHLPDIGADSADVTEILVNVGDAIEGDSSRAPLRLRASRARCY